jgi:magnesium chelatase family protein
MLAIAECAALVGLVAHPIRVEVEASRGIPSFDIVGLVEPAVRESRVRVKNALARVGVDIAEHRLVVNLAPADLRKHGTAFDLAIAVATLAALGAVPPESLGATLFLGELSLGGALLPLRGAIAHLMSARDRGVPCVVVPAANTHEAALLEGLDVLVAGSLEDVVASLRGTSVLAPPRRGALAVPSASAIEDLRDVRGQPAARRALEVAAAGGHNLLFIGPPGAGKSMLAKRLPGLLPPMSPDEALEVSAIHGVAGLSVDRAALGVRPFRSPHHTVSDVALVGGGDRARPGEISLAHRGVLFLDELSEFRRSALEALRQPLEDGRVVVTRSAASATFPSRPMLVGATNPCPCGRRGEGTGACQCKPDRLLAYRARLSGPIVDRLDLHVVLPAVDVLAMRGTERGEGSAAVRARVEVARLVQRTRFERGETTADLNAHLGAADLEHVCALDGASASLLAKAVVKYRLSARAYTKVLRLARTIADLEGRGAIAPSHVAEAVAGRALDRQEEHSATAA